MALAPTPNHHDIPAPNPRFLLLHASVARVLNASGRAESVDRFWRDIEEAEGLSSDGSSSEILAAALAMFEASFPSFSKVTNADDSEIESADYVDTRPDPQGRIFSHANFTKLSRTLRTVTFALQFMIQLLIITPVPFVSPPVLISVFIVVLAFSLCEVVVDFVHPQNAL